MGLVAPAGRVRVDCHLHTVASGDAVLTLEELAERATQTGLDVVCITDHNVTSAAVRATERDLGVRVIVGEEIRTPDGDVIGLFLTERIPYVLPLAEVIGRIKAQQALVYVPHPFDLARSSLGRVLPDLCAEGAADIIEVFNAKIKDGALNRQAADLARAFDLPGGAGSDAHDAPGVGAAYLEMPDFDGPAGFLAALADAQLTGEFRDHAVRYPRSVLPRPHRGVPNGVTRGPAHRSRGIGGAERAALRQTPADGGLRSVRVVSNRWWKRIAKSHAASAGRDPGLCPIGDVHG
jgi:predicted metal-dependent phosphoesterase TrpH